MVHSPNATTNLLCTSASPCPCCPAVIVATGAVMEISTQGNKSQSMSSHKDEESKCSDWGDSSLTSTLTRILPVFQSCFPSNEPGLRPMRWGLWSPHDRRWMRLVEDNYEANHREHKISLENEESYRIPPKIHHIWLGSQLPKAFARLRETWKSRHGGWQFRLWTDADVREFRLQNQKAYDSAGNFGQKSDILRYEILLREGGLYVDVDFACLGTFDELHRHYEFFTGLSNTGTFELNNGLIGCRPGHPIIRDIVGRIRDTCAPKQDDISVSERVGRVPDSSDVGTTPPFSGCGNPRAGVTTVSMGALEILRTAGGKKDGSGEANGARDPLAAIMSGFGKGGELVDSLLAGDDRTRLKEAVEVQSGSCTETIVTTGPGVFTIAVMQWMETPRAKTEASAMQTGASAPVEVGIQPGTDASSGPSTTMVLPPSYFYPVPNDMEGDLLGDGSEGGIESGRAGQFFREESLAAHLWAKSWQS